MNSKELKQIIEEGEGYKIEFKEILTGLTIEKEQYKEFGIRFGINEGINEGIKNRLLQEILHIKQYGFFTREIIERLSNISTATAERDIAFLEKIGIIKFEGSKKTGRYVLTEKGKKLFEEEL